MYRSTFVCSEILDCACPSGTGHLDHMHMKGGLHQLVQSDARSLQYN